MCGAQAGRHSYYGAYTCKSCKAFFRRSVTERLARLIRLSCSRIVQRRSYHDLKCGKGRRCPLDSVTRKKCMACRWRACLKAGNMSVTSTAGTDIQYIPVLPSREISVANNLKSGVGRYEAHLCKVQLGLCSLTKRHPKVKNPFITFCS